MASVLSLKALGRSLDLTVYQSSPHLSQREPAGLRALEILDPLSQPLATRGYFSLMNGK